MDTGTVERINVVTDALARTVAKAAADDDAGYRVFARFAGQERESDGRPSRGHAQHIARALAVLGLPPERVAGWYVRFEQAHHLDGSPRTPHRTAACIGTRLWENTQSYLKPPADHAAAGWLLGQIFDAMVDLGFDSIGFDDLRSAEETLRQLVEVGPPRLGGGE